MTCVRRTSYAGTLQTIKRLLYCDPFDPGQHLSTFPIDPSGSAQGPR